MNAVSFFFPRVWGSLTEEAGAKTGPEEEKLAPGLSAIKTRGSPVLLDAAAWFLMLGA